MVTSRPATAIAGAATLLIAGALLVAATVEILGDLGWSTAHAIWLAPALAALAAVAAAGAHDAYAWGSRRRGHLRRGR